MSKVRGHTVSTDTTFIGFMLIYFLGGFMFMEKHWMAFLMFTLLLLDNTIGWSFRVAFWESEAGKMFDEWWPFKRSGE